jgi:hypothetical protein
MDNKRIGNGLGDLLAEHGILTDTETTSIKRVITY